MIKNFLFEVWLPVKGYEGLYEVSNYGRVKSLDRYASNGKSIILYKGKILSNLIGSDQYYHVHLYKDGKRKPFLVHRLVADAFLSNDNNKREVNHIDENKLNNCVWNLEWVTSSENANYGTRNKRALETKKQNGLFKKVQMLSLDGLFIMEFDSITDAAAYVNGKKSNIWFCCNNKAKKAYNYKWRYA